MDYKTYLPDYKQYLTEANVSAALAVAVVLGLQFLSQIITLARIRAVITKVNDAIPRFHIKSEIKKTLVMFAIAFLVYFVQTQRHNPHTVEQILERPIYASLKIDKPEAYTPEPKKRCYPIDVKDEQQRDAAVQLMNHMRIFIPTGHVMVAANEFNSNAAILFSNSFGHMINPVITPLNKNRKWIQCLGKRVERYIAIKVKYVDYYFTEQETSLFNDDALHVQCMLIMFNI